MRLEPTVERARVLVVDDNRQYAALLCKFISLQPDMDVVGQAFGGAEALRLADFLRPDVVLMDLYMPGLNALDVIRLLKVEHADTDVVALTAHRVSELERCSQEAEAVAFVCKADVESQFLKTVRGINALQMRGET